MIGRLCNYCCKTVTRAFHTSPKRLSERENPISRTFRILREDLTRKKKSVVNRSDELTNLFPSHADIVIIGGGAVGSSVAYWLKEKTNAHALRIVVLEKDPSVSLDVNILILGYST